MDLGVAEWWIPVWRIERGGNRRERGRCRCMPTCTGTESNIDEEEKGEKVAGNKKRRGEERIREGRKMEAEEK